MIAPEQYSTPLVTDAPSMGSDAKGERRKVAQLQAEASLVNMRIKLLASAELLPEHRFIMDEVGRRAAMKFSDALIGKIHGSRLDATSQPPKGCAWCDSFDSG